MSVISAVEDILPGVPGTGEVWCVQRLIYPDAAVNSEDQLFFHGRGMSGFDTEAQAYFVLEGGEVCFDSYFNVFPAHLYSLVGKRVFAEIEGDGEILIEFMLGRQHRSWERLVRIRIKLVAGERKRILLPDILLDGVIYANIFGIDDSTIRDLDYFVVGPRLNEVTVTGVITTFKRDEAIQRTAARLEKYFDKNTDLADRFSLLVIDNGGDTDSIPFSRGEVIKNRNLGGAGGFTRGLKTAVDRGLSTHVLFMDDDASFFPESLRRTISLLSFAKTENMAISGAMITEAHKWRMWENGATFNKRCVPIDNGRDLRDFGQVMAMSLGQPRNVPNKYGGWWYFCFPIASVKVWPFPFFVRGDDSYFSLSNDFDIVTMPGVVAHQEDFFSKQTPMTVYLDFRYHMVHHLTFPGLKLSPKAIKAMIRRYFDRYNNSYHYESAEVVLMAIRDVMSGDAFWQANADMAERRKTIGGMTKQEKIVEDVEVNMRELTRHAGWRNNNKRMNRIRRWTHNGHSLPDFLFYSKGVLFPIDVRSIEHDSFLRSFTVTADPTTGRGYRLEIDKQRYFANRRELKALMQQFEASYPALVAAYGKSSATLTSEAAWSQRFGQDDAAMLTAPVAAAV